MRDSLHKFFKIGTIHAVSYPDQPALESLKKIACDDYFDVVEISQFTDGETRLKAKQLLEYSGLKVCYSAHSRLLSQGLNPNDLDENKRYEAELALIKGIDDAEYFGAKEVAFLSGKWSKDRKEDFFQQLLKTTRNACSYAAKKAMTLNLEVFDFDMDKASLIGPAPYAARFASEMRTTHNNFGLMVDLSHFPTTYETSRFVIQVLKPYINHFHIGNAVVKEGCEGYGDQHPRFGFPHSAHGLEELLDFFRVLKSEGFFNEREPYTLSIEVKPRPNEDPDIILANTKRVINRAWALLED